MKTRQFMDAVARILVGARNELAARWQPRRGDRRVKRPIRVVVLGSGCFD